MLKINNGVIDVCGYKLTVEKEPIAMVYAFKTLEQAHVAKASYEEAGFRVTISELDVADELFLDGKRCESMKQAKEWLAAGAIIEPLSLESLAEVVADLIGGAII